MPTDDHERHAFLLGRYWDTLGGDASEPATSDRLGDDVDPSLAQTITRLHRLAAAPAPAGSRERVWQRLHGTTADGAPTRTHPAGGTATSPNGRTPVAPFQPDRRPAERVQRSWRMAELATAAVVVLAILSGVLATRLAPSDADDDPPANAGIAATPTLTAAAPGPEACLVAPRTLAEVRAIAARAIPVVAPTAVPRRDVSNRAMNEPGGTAPAGSPADAATIAGVRSTLVELYACVNANDTMRLSALYSGNFILASFAEEASFAAFAAGILEGTPEPLRQEFHQRVPAIRDGDIRVLADGRAGLVLRAGGPTGTDSYTVFVKVGERWLLDESFLIAAGSAGTPAP